MFLVLRRLLRSTLINLKFNVNSPLIILYVVSWFKQTVFVGPTWSCSMSSRFFLIQKSNSSLFQRCQCFRRGFYRKTTVLGYPSSSCLIQFSHSGKRVVQNEKKSRDIMFRKVDDVSILKRQSVLNCSFMSTLIDDSDDFRGNLLTRRN